MQVWILKGFKWTYSGGRGYKADSATGLILQFPIKKM